MFWSVCSCVVFFESLGVAYAVHITVGTHKHTSEQIHYQYHKVLLALTFIAILPPRSHCVHAHTQEHCTLTHPWLNELGIRKSRGGFASTGGSCHKYPFCCGKTRVLSRQRYVWQIFDTCIILSRQKTCFVAKNMCLTNMSRQNFCWDKIMFVAIKHVFCRDKHVCRDKNDTCGSSRQWYFAAIRTNYIVLLWRRGHHRSRQNSS